MIRRGYYLGLDILRELYQQEIEATKIPGLQYQNTNWLEPPNEDEWHWQVQQMVVAQLQLWSYDNIETNANTHKNTKSRDKSRSIIRNSCSAKDMVMI